MLYLDHGAVDAAGNICTIFNEKFAIALVLVADDLFKFLRSFVSRRKYLGGMRIDRGLLYSSASNAM